MIQNWTPTEHTNGSSSNGTQAVKKDESASNEVATNNNNTSEKPKGNSICHIDIPIGVSLLIDIPDQSINQPTNQSTSLNGGISLFLFHLNDIRIWKEQRSFMELSLDGLSNNGATIAFGRAMINTTTLQED